MEFNILMIRRVFLKMLAGITVLFSSAESAWSYFISKLGVRTVEKDNFRFDPNTGMVHYKDTGQKVPYKLTVDGLVEKPLTLTYHDLRRLNLIEQVSDFHCVEGWSVKDIRWRGFRFSEIVKGIKPLKEARFVTFHALGQTRSRPTGQGHYIESFPLEALLDDKRQIVLAMDMNGKPLEHDHGAPLRVISPFDLAYKSIKYVHRIEFEDKQRKGWWTLANPIYPVEAPVPSERLGKK